jgi:hypothetical protein
MTTTTKPVHRLVIYRPKAGHRDQLLAILKQHGPTLRTTGLLAADMPVQLFEALDLQRHGTPMPYFVEMFHWRDEEASDLAHQMPEVMSVWETMGPHMEGMTLTTLASI